MAYERFIGMRYLMAKKRSRVVSIITLISICGVALGVTALIVVLSVMGGFKKDLKDKILGTKAHAVVKPAEGDDIVDAHQTTEKARSVEGVVGAEPYLQADVMVSSPTNLSGVVLRGIEPKLVGQVSELGDDMVEGKLDYLVDPGPLLKELDAQRERDIDEILERVGKEREDLEREKKKAAERAAEKGTRPAQTDDAAPDGPTDEASDQTSDQTGDQTGDDAFEMPPLPGQDDGARADQAGSDGQADDAVMPPIFDDEDEGDTAEMPPMFGEGDGGGQEGGQHGGDGADVGADHDKLPGIVIGTELAKSLQAELGRELNVVTPEGDMGPTGMMPRSRPFRVVGIFKTGMYEYDANYAYTSFAQAKDFLNREGASGIEIKTTDPDHAIAIADVLQKKLGDQFEVLDWKEMNRSLFFALKLEKIAMFVVLAFIILVASFSIIAMLIMIVIEKARDIAILKSMGVPDRGIQHIFVFQGLVIGSIGTLIGLLGGLGICAYLKVYGVPLDSEVYYISTLPVEVNIWEVLSVIVCAVFISFAATLYPAYLASKLKPVDGLRYD